MKFSQTLRQFRGRCSRNEASNRLDVKCGTYRAWEEGRNEPSIETQETILRRIKALTNNTKEPT